MTHQQKDVFRPTANPNKRAYVAKPNITKPKTNNHAQPLKCMTCEFETCRANDLKRHNIKAHVKPKTYKCTGCTYATQWESGLKRHVKATHLQLKDFICTECKYATSRKDKLQAHVRQHHAQPLTRMKWEFKTCKANNLKGHNKAHVKPKTYKCTDCTYATPRKTILKRHVKATHLQLKDNICTECKYATSRKDNLQAHVRKYH